MENFKKKFQILLDLFKSRNFEKAESFCKDMINSYPKFAILYNIMGLIYTEQKKYDSAIDYYNKGIKAQPNFAMLYNNLGSIYKHRQEYTKAESYYEKAIYLDKKISEPHNNLGNLYKTLNKHGASINCYKNSIKINPNFSVSHYNLGITYKSLGDFDLAKKHLRQSIKINPHLCFAHRSLSQIIKYTAENEHLKMMKKIYSDSKLNNIQKKELAFGLGKASEDIKDFSNAYSYFKEGNKMHRDTIDFSYESEKKEFENITKTFDQNLIKKFRYFGNQDQSAIFIVGMPRSGTTLVEQIISNHPSVFGGDELDFLSKLVEKNFGNKFSNENFNKLMNDDKSRLIEIGNEYIKKLKEISKKEKKITDKLPINFKWIGLIKLILPNSKIIHCSRNPKDNCISIYKNYFTSKELNFAYRLDEVCNFYLLYHDLMNHWSKVLPEFVYHIKYEKLILNPKNEVRSLLKYCDLNWNDKCLNFHKNKRVIKTASDTQARKRIYKNSINSWKNYEKLVNKFFNKLPS